MTNYKGSLFVLKNGTWSGGVTVGDCQNHSLKFNNQTVDITNKSSNGYRTFLEGAGTKSVSITLNGIMTNDAGYEQLQGYCTNGTINTHSMAWADGDILEGSFMATGLDIGGKYDGEQTFSVTLESSGAWTFTAA